MTKIIAVSGGVDSVVLLDILSRSDDRLMVAHVDHGIREESGDDARFVEGLARSYQLPFVSTELELGDSASEEVAREGRYEFLFAKAKEFGATVLTAHHQDDMIGSIAINLARGTGWRGLAVMNRPEIERPLLGWTKRAIYQYAIRNCLEWTEDASNQSDKYLRNRLRAGVVGLDQSIRSQVEGLRAKQLQLSREIARELDRVSARFGNSRYQYSAVEAVVAVELLRYRFSVTTPHAEQALLAIKTARPGSTHTVNKHLKLRFTKTEFIVDSHL